MTILTTVLSGPVLLLWTPQLFLFAFIWLSLRIYSWRLLSSNRTRRKALLGTLGYKHGEDKRVVGFFHPYW